jgi:hypothetical protein
VLYACTVIETWVISYVSLTCWEENTKGKLLSEAVRSSTVKVPDGTRLILQLRDLYNYEAAIRRQTSAKGVTSAHYCKQPVDVLGWRNTKICHARIIPHSGGRKEIQNDGPVR